MLIAYDEQRYLNNGQPSLWAFIFDKLNVVPGERVLHLGCGMGYYTAILAELVGPTGEVSAIEIDKPLAERAREALALWPHVTVANGDGANGSFRQVRRRGGERWGDPSVAVLARLPQAEGTARFSNDGWRTNRAACCSRRRRGARRF